MGTPETPARSEEPKGQSGADPYLDQELSGIARHSLFGSTEEVLASRATMEERYREIYGEATKEELDALFRAQRSGPRSWD